MDMLTMAIKFIGVPIFFTVLIICNNFFKTFLLKIPLNYFKSVG